MQINPMGNVAKRTEPRGRVRHLSDDEREALLKECQASKSETLYPIVIVALSTGMRKGEILGLSWDVVDLERGVITLLDNKNGERRGVPITGRALEILKARLRVRRIDTNLGKA